MAKQSTSHRHILFEERPDGQYNMYAMEFISIVDGGDCKDFFDKADLTKSGKPRDGRGSSSSAPRSGKQPKRRGGKLLSGMQDLAETALEGNGYPIPILPDRSLAIRNTDPRIFAIMFERRPDTDQYPGLKRWTEKGSKKAIEDSMFATDFSGRPLELRVNPRLVRTPDDFSEYDIDAHWIWRLTDRNRRPKDFDLDSMISLRVFDESGNYTGVKLVLANRTAPTKYKELADVSEYIDRVNGETLE